MGMAAPGNRTESGAPSRFCAGPARSTAPLSRGRPGATRHDPRSRTSPPRSPVSRSSASSGEVGWGSSIKRGRRNWPGGWPSKSSGRASGSVQRIAGAGGARLGRSGGSPSQRRPAPRSGRSGRLPLPRPRPERGREPGGPRHRSLAARVAVELMAAVAVAVEQIHRAGLLHLDINPSHILLDGLWDQVTPMLADFRHRRGATTRVRRRPVRSGSAVRPRSWPRNRSSATAPGSASDPTCTRSGPPCTAS